MELSIIIPAFNEEATVLEAIQRALDAELPVVDREVIVVENGSTDGTRARLRSREWPADVQILEFDVNRGKGGAVRAAVDRARGKYLAIFDADLEYDPNDYAPMILALTNHGADAVLGTRQWQVHTAYSFWYVIGNRAINLAANALYNVWLSDSMVGMKLVPADLFRSLGLREDGFGFDAEIVARLIRRGARIYEVPVRYESRGREAGKKLRAVDGLRILRVFLTCRF
jgi:glycosyltransferase involved in cell wall biosynthesis